MPYRQCNGVTKAGKRCRTGAQAGSDYCGNHQDQAHGNREAAMAASFREQSDETKRFVMSKVEEIEGACPTCGLTDYIVNGTCEPCAIYYGQIEQPQMEESTMNDKDPDNAYEQERDHQYESTIKEPLFVAVTGHRPQKVGGYNFSNPIRTRLREEFGRVLDKLQQENPDKEICVIVGGALGVDQDFARVAHSKSIPFEVHVPFRGQERKWPQRSQESYRRMLEVANNVIYVDERDGKDMTYKQVAAAMQKRNISMIDACDVLVAAWNGSKEGGTANAVAYADGKKDTIFISPAGEKTRIRRVSK